MINLQTPSKELKKVLAEENEKAIYWLKKHWGGEKGYERMRDKLLEKATHERKSQRSELVEYKSRQGNRWLVYEEATYFPDTHSSNTMPYAFCYWETYGSVGMFMQCEVLGRTDGKKTTFIFTSHFFQRMCDEQRQMEKMVGRQTIVEFLNKTYGMSVIPYTDKEGRKAVDVRLKDAIGRGFARKDDNTVFEIRTVLTDKMLSSAQRKYTKEIRERGDIFREFMMPKEELYVKTYMEREQAKADGRLEEYDEEMYEKGAKMTGIKKEVLKSVSDMACGLFMMCMKSQGKDFDAGLYLKHNNHFVEVAYKLYDAWQEWKGSEDEYNELMIDEMCKLEDKVHIGMTRKKLTEYLVTLKQKQETV